MITEKNKATRIMKEIVNYYLTNQLYTFDLHFNFTDKMFELSITAQADAMPATFPQLLNDLCVPRQLEIDEYYNALLGSHTVHDDFTFLGKTIDEAYGNYEDKQLTLIIRRYIL